MAFLDDVFGKKGEGDQEGEPQGAPPQGQASYPQQQPQQTIPVEQILTMRQQGYANNQIVDALQRAGWGMDQINAAVRQADMKESVEGQQPVTGQPQEQYEQYPQYPQQDQGRSVDRQVQEVAEAVVEEKWQELVSSVQKVIDWKDQTESRLTKLEQRMDDLKSSFDSLHEGVLGRVEEYDRGIREVGTEIKAMEKVFQKILPNFVESVNELSRITKDLGSKRKTSKK